MTIAQFKFASQPTISVEPMTFNWHGHKVALNPQWEFHGETIGEFDEAMTFLYVDLDGENVKRPQDLDSKCVEDELKWFDVKQKDFDHRRVGFEPISADFRVLLERYLEKHLADKQAIVV